MSTKTLKPGHKMGLYDSDTNESLFADKVLHINKELVVLYCVSKRGRIAQLCSLYSGGKIGASVHYFVGEMTARSLSNDVVFQRFVSAHSGDPMKVAIKIIANA